jgi:hypothetical protein
MQPYLIGDYNEGVDSGVNHPGFKFGWATNDDSMRQHQGIGVVLQVPRDSANPTKQGINVTPWEIN